MHDTTMDLTLHSRIKRKRPTHQPSYHHFVLHTHREMVSFDTIFRSKSFAVAGTHTRAVNVDCDECFSLSCWLSECAFWFGKLSQLGLAAWNSSWFLPVCEGISGYRHFSCEYCIIVMKILIDIWCQCKKLLLFASICILSACTRQCDDGTFTA